MVVEDGLERVIAILHLGMISDSYSWSGSCSCAEYYQHYDSCATGSSSNTCYKSNANHDGCSCSGNYVSSTPSCTKTDANHDGCSVTGTYYTYSD